MLKIPAMRFFLFLISLLLTVHTYAQSVQTVLGQVKDKESHEALPGAVIIFTDLDAQYNTATDSAGYFHSENIPVGKHSMRVSMVGYKTIELPQVLFTTGKEVVLNIELQESVGMLKEVSVTAQNKHRVNNEMALVSVKRFDIQETERFAGSRGDPARMASNYAGVQGADDSRNDIIVRGNSPQGVLWQLEDVPIPNPNHFAVPGTTGGPVSIINNKTLGNSDFFAGAFPAEYGNATGGVFDLKMRNGNYQRHEVSAQLGFLGTELAAEGPLSQKNKSSYLITYRYSTLKLFEGLNIKIGTSSVPNYQDAALKLHLPVSKNSSISLFGVGGLSHIDLIVSNLNKPSDELYGENDRDQYFTSNTGVLGLSFQSTLKKRSLVKIVISQNANHIYAHHDKVFRNINYEVDSLKPILGYSFKVFGTVTHAFFNHKIGTKYTLRAGVINTFYYVSFLDSSRQYPTSLQTWQHRNDYAGSTDLLQPYIQGKWNASDALSATIGLHAAVLTHNGSAALEARLAVRYQAGSKTVFNAGYGLHSQMQQLYQYFAHLPQNSPDALHNVNLGFTRSHHLIAGWDQGLLPYLRMRTEVYVQYLFHVPIEKRAGSSFSGLNQGAGFDRLFPDTLVNKGTGYNYGLELTLEKSFHKGYYLLFTGSLFDSKAKGNDGVYRNTDYNTRFAFNLLGGYEKTFGERSTLIAGLKATYAGGRLYSPPDTAASNAIGELVVIDNQRNTLRFPDYFRLDVKLGFRYNARKVTHEVGLDLVNVLGIKNILSLNYSSELAAQGRDPYFKQYQLGFLPLFYYRVDFSFSKRK